MVPGLHAYKVLTGDAGTLTIQLRSSHQRTSSHSFKSSQKPPRRSSYIFASDDKSQSDLISGIDKQGAPNRHSRCYVDTACAVVLEQTYVLFSGPTLDKKLGNKPSVPHKPEGELQLLPNRRFFLAGLGSLSISTPSCCPC